MTAPFRIEPLADHDRTQFTCGVAALDTYFHKQVSQDVRRRVATCFVAVDANTDCVVGYYTLAATGVAMTDLPSKIANKLPRYPIVPAALLGRLAVAREAAGQGLGTALVVNALRRIAKNDLAVVALFVDAMSSDVLPFYERLGFTLLPGESRRLVLPIATALPLIT